MSDASSATCGGGVWPALTNGGVVPEGNESVMVTVGAVGAITPNPALATILPPDGEESTEDVVDVDDSESDGRIKSGASAESEEDGAEVTKFPEPSAAG